MCSVFSKLKLKIHGLFYSNKIAKFESQKKQIEDELRLGEKKFFKREISQEAFQLLNSENQRKLIEINAEIALLNAKMKLEKLKPQESMKFTGKRKDKFYELLNEKDALMHSFNEAKKKFFTRKIDEKTYKEILNSNQKKLVRLESRIDSVYIEQAREIIVKAEKKISMNESKKERIKTREISDDLMLQIRKGEFD